MIVVGQNAEPREHLAAKELQRYLGLLTGVLPTVRPDSGGAPDGAALIVIGREDGNAVLSDLVRSGRLPDAAHRPGAEGYVIRTVDVDGRTGIAVLGSDPAGVLFGSYRLLEQYGVRFYLSRDVLPPGQQRFEVKQLNLTEAPSVEHRGLLPWHDFLNGPSAYGLEDFQRYIEQMSKMRMNTLVLHNYAGGYPTEDINEPFMSFTCQGQGYDGHLDTSVDNQRWGLATSYADDLAFDSGRYLPFDVLGSDAARFTRQQPQARENTFAKAKAMMKQIIGYGQARGVEVVLGADFDLVPAQLRSKCNPLDPDVLKRRLDDILQTYPTLNHIQMYYSESNGVTTAQGIEAYKVMHAYLAEKAPNVRLLTGSWFQEERFPEMDAALPKDVIFSTLMPHDMSVKPQWAGLSEGRDAWAVPWMEFDGGLSEPQLAVKLMEQRLPTLREAGVEGVIGILWRERAVEPNVAYLAQDGWQPAGKALPAGEFYRDYAASTFGDAASAAGAEAFNALEDAGVYGYRNGGVVTPEYTGWKFGGGAQADVHAARYRAVGDRFNALKPLVTAPGNRDDLELWAESMRWAEKFWTARSRVPDAAAKAGQGVSDNYFLVDSGGQGEKDLIADRWYHGNTSAASTSGRVVNDFGYPQAMRTERWSSERFGYTFPIPQGYDRYRIELFFQEGWFGVAAPGDPIGKRVFNIEIDGRLVRENFDIAKEAGGSLRGVKLTYDVVVPADRQLDIDFVPVVSNPAVDAVRAFPIDADGNALPATYPPSHAEEAWKDLKHSGFREAIDAYQKSVRDLPLLGGLVSAAGGRWYSSDTEGTCPRCTKDPYVTYERRVVEQLPAAPPTGLVVRGTPEGAVLTWRPYPGRAGEVAGYRVYRAPASGGEFTRLTAAPLSETSYRDDVDGEFRYAVTAVTKAGVESPRSYEETVAAGAADRTAPYVLMMPSRSQTTRHEALPVTATLIDGRTPQHLAATLRWRLMGQQKWDAVPMRTNVVGRATTFVAAIPASAFAPGKPVEYYVEASDGANTGHSPANDGIHSVTVLEPAGPTVGGVEKITVQDEAESKLVNWSAADGPVFIYEVYRGSHEGFAPGPDTYLTYVPGVQREFRDATAEPGRKYVYKVVPVTFEGRSGPASPPGR
ncbi:malectin domain-containing carbohydrate-binding protein [Microtetraspora sp. NBRC 16547]|uniref:malectin domain-containing carbohydrate-binding protein n=1 Tax=Microtetraspora sp. NBRC 16547 TaxID=3030993 RepID=UPI002552948A|nr:malectin domain-containing carbohydrate-binding protein [Microtetraspora sp. NBRC 16547]